MQEKIMQESPIILALDYSDINPARALVKQLSPSLCALKVGPVMFTRYGLPWVQELIALGYRIFLDLKFHDIPTTIAGACRAAAEAGVWMVSMHVAGGPEMLQQAVAALRAGAKQRVPLAVGITVLTSLNDQDLRQIGWSYSVAEMATNLAHFGMQAGLNGLVCSPHEVAALRSIVQAPGVLVTPGIQLQHAAADQKRTMLPAQALQAGADYLVIGRAITQAANPAAQLTEILSGLDS